MCVKLIQQNASNYMYDQYAYYGVVEGQGPIVGRKI